jgi:hypothetical protein
MGFLMGIDSEVIARCEKCKVKGLISQPRICVVEKCGKTFIRAHGRQIRCHECLSELKARKQNRPKKRPQRRYLRSITFMQEYLRSY